MPRFRYVCNTRSAHGANVSSTAEQALVGLRHIYAYPYREIGMLIFTDVVLEKGMRGIYDNAPQCQLIAD